MDFNTTLESLKNELKNSIAAECLNSMTDQEVLFLKGFTQEKEKLTSLYLMRLNMAREINKEKYKQDEIDNWAIAVDKLIKSTCKQLRLNSVSTDDKTFMLFWNSKTDKLIAIFYFYSRSSNSDIEKNYDSTVEQGYAVTAVKYKNGRFIKEW